MIQQVLLEASLDKMRNMGVPAPIAKQIHNMASECEEQSFWFAQQLKASMHQWDDYVGEYKKATKTLKRIVKGLKSDEFHQRKGRSFEDMRRALAQEEMDMYVERGDVGEGQQVEDLLKHFVADISDEDVTRAMLGIPKGAGPAALRGKGEQAEAWAKAEEDVRVSLQRLSRVLHDTKESISIICKWANETGVTLSKKKKIKIVSPTGEESVVPFDMAAAERAAYKHFGIQQGDVFMVFEKSQLDLPLGEEEPATDIGWYWLDRGVNYCSIEAKLMQHCGRSDHTASTIWSLRDPKGMPHVTAEIKTDSDGNRIVYQMKGKQNRTPDPKYHPYIYALLTNPKFNLHVYAARGSYGGDLTWDDIPEGMQAKIIAANKDTYEEKSEEELRQESFEGRYEALQEALNQADRDVPLEHVDVTWETQTDEGDEEPYINIYAYANFRLFPDGFSFVNNWKRGLVDHLERSGASLPLRGSDGWDREDVRIEEDRTYRGWRHETGVDGISIGISEYEDLYSEDEYKQLLEEYQEWEQDEEGYAYTTWQIERYFASIGAIDFEENNADFGFIETMVASDLDWNTVLRGNEIVATRRIGYKTGHPIHQLDNALTEQFAQSLVQGTPYAPVVAENSTRITLDTKRGSDAVYVNFRLTFYTEVSEEEEEESQEERQNQRMKFAFWVDENMDEIRELLQEVTQQHLKNPYDVDSYASDLYHLQEALNHNKLMPKGFSIKTWKQPEGFVSFDSDPSNPPFWQLLDLVYGPDEAAEYPGYEAMKTETYWPLFSIPGKVEDYTIGEWGKLIQGAMDDYELTFRYAIKKYGTSTRKAVEDLWREQFEVEKKAKKKKKRVSERAIRALIRSSLSLPERSSHSQPQGSRPSRKI